MVKCISHLDAARKLNKKSAYASAGQACLRRGSCVRAHQPAPQPINERGGHLRGDAHLLKLFGDVRVHTIRRGGFIRTRSTGPEHTLLFQLYDGQVHTASLVSQDASSKWTSLPQVSLENLGASAGHPESWTAVEQSQVHLSVTGSLA